MADPVFDFAQIPVPFRMQPGLQRLDASARHLTPLVPGSALWLEKKRVVDAGASRLQVPGYDTGWVIAALQARAAAEGLAWSDPLELAFEQDFAVLEAQGATLPWMAVCVPSHWRPEEKIGQPFAAVHAPVADAALLIAASAQLTRLATGGEAWERWVWTVTPDTRHDQHPGRQARLPWPVTPEPAQFLRECFLRVERQTFFPMAAPQPQAVFTIHVRVQPLCEAVTRPQDAQRLHDALASMSDAVLAYKGLLPARDRLLAGLRQGVA